MSEEIADTEKRERGNQGCGGEKKQHFAESSDRRLISGGALGDLPALPPISMVGEELGRLHNTRGIRVTAFLELRADLTGITPSTRGVTRGGRKQIPGKDSPPPGRVRRYLTTERKGGKGEQ